eukprot:1833471-Alexandrium_andersonii.AAC.1
MASIKIVRASCTRSAPGIAQPGQHRAARLQPPVRPHDRRMSQVRAFLGAAPHPPQMSPRSLARRL